MPHPGQTERMRRCVALARALDLTPDRVRQCERAGMPTDTLANALAWRTIRARTRVGTRR